MNIHTFATPVTIKPVRDTPMTRCHLALNNPRKTDDDVVCWRPLCDRVRPVSVSVDATDGHRSLPRHAVVREHGGHGERGAAGAHTTPPTPPLLPSSDAVCSALPHWGPLPSIPCTQCHPRALRRFFAGNTCAWRSCSGRPAAGTSTRRVMATSVTFLSPCCPFLSSAAESLQQPHSRPSRVRSTSSPAAV